MCNLVAHGPQGTLNDMTPGLAFIGNVPARTLSSALTCRHLTESMSAQVSIPYLRYRSNSRD